MRPSSSLSALLQPLLWVLFCCDRLSSESPASLGSRPLFDPVCRWSLHTAPCLGPQLLQLLLAQSPHAPCPLRLRPQLPPAAAPSAPLTPGSPVATLSIPGDSLQAGSASPRGPLCAVFAFGSQQVLHRHQSIDTNRFQLRQLSRANIRLLISLQNVSCAILKLFRMCSPARGICQRQKGSRPPCLGGGSSRVT